MSDFTFTPSLQIDMDHECLDGKCRRTRTPSGGRRRKSKGRTSSDESIVQHKRYRRDGETSLVSLTQQFMHMLMNAPGWRLDMNEVANALSMVNSKRRLYDVTGVLLGASLVWKPAKNMIAWNGFETMDEYQKTSEEIAALLDVEKRIDRDLEYMKAMIEKMSTLDEAYLTKEDIAPLYKDKTVMFVRGPTDTDLLVPTVSDAYMFSLKSPSDPIDVFLFSDAEEDDETTKETNTPVTESVEVEEFNRKPPRTTRMRALKEVSNIEHCESSFSDSASVLLRGLYPGPFQERELSPQKPKKHAVNFIPLEPVNCQNKPPIASYRAESAAFRAPAPRKKMRKR